MRYPGSEKLEILRLSGRLVEQSHLPVRQTLAMLGILPGSARAGRCAGRTPRGEVLKVRIIDPTLADASSDSP